MSTMQDLGPFEKLLTLQFAEADLEAAKGRAARRISRELKIKGFRPGKAPRKIVEATVGAERVRAEAIEELLPEIVTDALSEENLTPAVPPSVEQLRDIDSGVEIEVKVTMWPTLGNVPLYSGREFEVENPGVEEQAIDDQLDRLREQFAELDTVTRPSVDGDFVSVNLTVTRNGELLEAASASDLLYEVGSNSFIEGLDQKTIGRSAGDIEKFDTTLPAGFGDLGGTEVSIMVLIKEVKEKKLPELNDEWVSDFTEFETVDEIRAELTERLDGVRLNAVREAFQSKVVGALLDEMDLEIPDAVVNNEMEETFHRFGHQLSESGIEFADYLELSGQTQEAFAEDLKRQAARSVQTDVLLDAVAQAEALTLDDDEVDALYEALASQTDESAGDLRERLADSVQEKRIVGDILRRKALATILQSAVPVDENGSSFDLGFDSAASKESDDGPEQVTGEVTDNDTVDDNESQQGEQASEEPHDVSDDSDPEPRQGGDDEPEGGTDES